MENILEIKNLSMQSDVDILKNVSIKIKKAQTLALVGQSGSGKSMLAHAILNLLPRGANFKLQGEISFQDKDILSLKKSELEKLRGKEISMIFQEPMTALNPLHKIKAQIEEITYTHNLISKSELSKRAISLLEKVELQKNNHKQFLTFLRMDLTNFL